MIVGEWSPGTIDSTCPIKKGDSSHGECSCLNSGEIGIRFGAGRQNPELTILVPTLNEEITVETFLDWCHEGIERSGVSAEIILVDSSGRQHARESGGKGSSYNQAVTQRARYAHIKKVSLSFAASTSSWAIRIAPTTSASWNRSSKSCAMAK